jgi:hypothetical protein
VVESQKKAGLIYTGSDDGQVNVTRDGGTSWTNLTAKISGVPKWSYVSRVEPSKFDEGTVYVTFDGHRTGDYGSYIYASSDFGNSWRSIVGNLPRGEVVRSITEDLKVADLLYLGTESGLYVTLDRGKSWVRVRANLPTVPIYEITLHPRDNAMILATHGRAVWILDQLSPFQEAAKADLAEGHIYTMAPAYQLAKTEYRYHASHGDMRFIGDNPAFSAAISYRLKSKADSARIVIKDNAGNQIRELKGDAMKDGLAQGFNTAHWDFSIEPIPAPKGASKGGGFGGFFGGGGGDGSTAGPTVLPGDFRATLVVNGKELATTGFKVAGDPDITITDADRQRRFDLLKEAQRLQAKVALSDSTTTPAPIRAELDSLMKQIDPLKKKFFIRDEGDDSDFDFALFRKVITFKISGLISSVGGATVPASEADLAAWAEVKTEAPATIDEVNALVARLKPFYQKLAEAGLYPAVPKPIDK